MKLGFSFIGAKKKKKNTYAYAYNMLYSWEQQPETLISGHLEK